MQNVHCAMYREWEGGMFFFAHDLCILHVLLPQKTHAYSTEAATGVFFNVLVRMWLILINVFLSLADSRDCSSSDL